MKKEITKKENKIVEKKDEKKPLPFSIRLTEKASKISVDNFYTFNVEKDVNKIILKKAIEKEYKVKVLKISIINHPREIVFIRGRMGFKSAFKKAMVKLKKGDKINLG